MFFLSKTLLGIFPVFIFIFHWAKQGFSPYILYMKRKNTPKHHNFVIIESACVYGILNTMTKQRGIEMKQAETRGKQAGFAPIYNEKSRVLILGTYPSPKSFEFGFYYGHAQNRFWPLLAALCNTPCPCTREEKETLLFTHNIALWDVLERCTIQGAADSSIRNETPNNLPLVFNASPIEAVFCNGAAAHRLYQKHFKDLFSQTAHRMPSTSAANAACNLNCLLGHWAPLRAYVSPSASGFGML